MPELHLPRKAVMPETVRRGGEEMAMVASRTLR